MAPSTPEAPPTGAVPEAEAVDAALVRSAIGEAMREGAPLDLDADDLDRLSELVVEIRRLRLQLAAHAPSQGNVEVRAALGERLGRAMAAFEETAGMSPAEFTREVEPEVGLTREGDPDDVVFRPLEE